MSEDIDLLLQNIMLYLIMSDLICELESRLIKVLKAHPGLGVYTFSLEGHYYHSNIGSYKLIGHLNDPSVSGGVRHVEISAEDSVNIDQYHEIEAWMKALGARYEVERPVSSDLIGPS